MRKPELSSTGASGRASFLPKAWLQAPQVLTLQNCRSRKQHGPKPRDSRLKNGDVCQGVGANRGRNFVFKVTHELFTAKICAQAFLKISESDCFASMCTSDACRGQEVLGPLELELSVVMSQHVHAGNGTLIFCKSNKC